MSRHLSGNEIQDYLDGGLTSDARAEAEQHLYTCRQCRSLQSSLTEVDRALKSLPREQLDARFTRSVMSRLTAGQADSLSFKILEKLAYVFALFVVLAVLLAAFIFSGVIDARQVSDGQSRIQEFLSGSTSQMKSQVAAFSNLLAEYAPFVFGVGSLCMAGTIFAVVALLAVLDRFLVRRFVH